MPWHALRHVLVGSALVGATLATSAVEAQAIAPEPPPPVLPWYEAIDFTAFVDAYANINWAFPKPQTGTNRFRAYDVTNGFALSWIGLDASYAPDPVGGALALRLGPTAEIHAKADSEVGLEFVKEAFASWMPGGADSSVRVDLGKFDKLVGAEVADSQLNLNYTRGLLYWLAQPQFHTGLRASWQVISELELKAFVVNGWNRSIDDNIGKTFGFQAGVRPWHALGISLGWLGGPEQPDVTSVDCPAGTAYDPDLAACAPAPGTSAQTYTVDRGGANDFEAWRHLFDLVITFDPLERLRIVLNADYGLEGLRVVPAPSETVVETQRWYGAMLGAHYQLDEVFAVAARGEYYADPEGHTTTVERADGTRVNNVELVSGTLTLEAVPAEFFILRLEGRADFALGDAPVNELFFGSVRGGESSQYTTTLGVVVTTN
jgi:hypothetical protein